MYVRNVADVGQYNIVKNSTGTAASNTAFMSFNPPLEIPEGYDICIYSLAATAWAYGSVFGWEE